MSTIEWTPALSVGEDEIDAQHQKLFSIIEALMQAQKDALDTKAIHSILSQLVDYSGYHFRTEDNYMIDNNYPLFMSHRKEHLAYINKMGELITALEKKDAKLPQDMLDFLSNWWREHIANSDLRYARYIKSQQK